MKFILKIIQLAYLVMPLVCGGVTNMFFMKRNVLNCLKKPIDGGRTLKDGKRLLGDNKTWKGLAGWVVFTSIWFWILGIFGRILGPVSRIAATKTRFKWLYLLLGALYGMSYAVSELPNSYLKRRLDIAPGKNASGVMGLVFKIHDQADSMTGCTIFMLVLRWITLAESLLFLVIASIMHYLTNIWLHNIGLKNQKG